LVGKSEGKNPLGRHQHRWEDIKMDLRKIGFGGVDWIHLAQDTDLWWALVNMVMHLQMWGISLTAESTISYSALWVSFVMSYFLD
jgi:hypothetical protein